jgi:FkbM family methyltransferase
VTAIPILRLIRERFHPLHHARRVPALRAVLAGVDKPVWARLEWVSWPVRVRTVRHLAYILRSATPEREIAALTCAIVDVLAVARFADVGANFGFYTWLLKSRSPDLSVDLIEPEIDNLALIDATLSRTRLTDVRVHRIAASAVARSARFRRDLVSGGTGTLDSGERSYAETHWGVSASTEVPTARIDDLLTDGVDLLKIDVEGHEEQVLNGAEKLLKRDAPVVLFECFHGHAAAPAALETFGYELFDSEHFTEPTASTSNYLAIPTRFSPRVDDIRHAWEACLRA